MPPRQNTDDFAWSPTIRAIILTLVAVVTAAIAAIPAETVTDAGSNGDAALAGIMLAGNLATVAPPEVSPHATVRVEARPVIASKRPSSAHPKVTVHSPARWVPTGTGMWTYVWSQTAHGNARAIVAKARAAHMSTIYLRTASLHTMFLSNLRSLLLASRGTGIRIVAWDFPTLSNPVADARRLATAARYRVAGQRVAAVAPDIETPAEGTHLSGPTVSRYLTTLRRWLPRDVSILPTVPWPSKDRIGRYPYRVEAPFADAFIPMAYWYNHSSYQVTLRSIHYLRQFHRPVIPVGQGYDSRVDAPYLPRSNQRAEFEGFLRAARAARVQAISVWVWQTAGPAQWGGLYRARSWFGTPFHPAAGRAPVISPPAVTPTVTAAVIRLRHGELVPLFPMLTKSRR